MKLKDKIYETVHGDLISIQDNLAAEHIEDCAMCSWLIESMTELIAKHYHHELD